MRLQQTEYLLKGIYLGLALYAALQLTAVPPADEQSAWACLVQVNLISLAGLGAALLLAAVGRLREGYRVRGRLVAFVLFLLLESPTLTYIGVLAGTLGGVYLNRVTLAGLEGYPGDTVTALFTPTLVGAALAGLAFGMLRQVRHRLYRLGLILLLAGALVVTGMAWLGDPTLAAYLRVGKPFTLEPEMLPLLAVQLLLAIPFFYVLTFAGIQEESEVEIGAICVLLAVGLGLLFRKQSQLQYLAFLLPAILYLGYTLRILPGLRVAKHAFRGMSFARSGRHRLALLSFRRALQLDPNSRLARDGFWEVHRLLDLDQLVNDPQTLALVDLDLCLDRAGSLLLGGRPTPAQAEESARLLDLVVRLSPDHRPRVDYWRAVALTHAGRFEEAAESLTRVLDPGTYGAENPHRQATLLQAWELGLLWHSEVRRLAGDPQLAVPGRRMEAIAAVERFLAENASDADGIELKKLLYRDLTEADYDAYAGEGITAEHFDHAFAQHLGVGLIEHAELWPRGGEYLRLAARGLPALGPTLFLQIARAHQRVGNQMEARHNFELARRAGQGVGPKNLADPERQAYFQVVKHLAEEAMASGDNDAAIENLHLYTEYERSGIETYRALAELYERRGDALAAARAASQGLCYNSGDKDLVERKDRYYYSVQPEELAARRDTARIWFDVDYCLRKAKSILEGPYQDFDWLDVAHHLAKLALVIQPESPAARVLMARLELRVGERENALELLQKVREPKPERFATTADEEAWYIACQLLGDLYLELGDNEKAVACFLDFQKSPKSGARTWFKLGQAYESLGDRARASKCYRQVTAYDGNPLAPEAEDALARLQT